MTSRSRVCVIHTGGTIGMRPSAEGWVPAPGHLEEQVERNPVFRAEGMPECRIVELDPLLDSSEVGPPHWVGMAGEIERRYDDHDGFVVLHGTDTMAYTASALAFMLEELGKTVVFTGSQVPLCRPRNDAQSNLVGSLLLAAGYRIPEVCLFFDSRLYRGCRTVKVRCDRFDAFDSPNLPPLAVAGTHIQLRGELVRRPPGVGSSGLRVLERLNTAVGVLWLFPGITGAVVHNLLQPPLEGVVLRAFGVGNGPVHDAGFVAALEEANDRGVVIVDCTQCLTGSVRLGDYATGTGLARAGAIGGYDMTGEAALTKLMHLLGQGHDPDEVKRLMQRNLRGELTEPEG